MYLGKIQFQLSAKLCSQFMLKITTIIKGEPNLSYFSGNFLVSIWHFFGVSHTGLSEISAGGARVVAAGGQRHGAARGRGGQPAGPAD